MPNRLYQRQRLRFSKDTRFTELLESVDIAITGQEDDRQVGQTSEDGFRKFNTGSPSLLEALAALATTT